MWLFPLKICTGRVLPDSEEFCYVLAEQSRAWQPHRQGGEAAAFPCSERIESIDLCDNLRWMIKFGLLGPRLKIQFR